MINKQLNQSLREKYNPDGSTLRMAQLRMLEMLKFIDSICTSNGITYWLDSGTLLGAVRHGGFIPWDDDTDICMPLNDLKRFKKIMMEKNPSNEFVLQCHETDPGYLRLQWLVLRDLKSEYLQNDNLHNDLFYKGLQVDIFPLENNISPFLKKITDRIQTFLIFYPTWRNNWYYRVLKPFRKITWIITNRIIIPLFRCIKCKKDYYTMSYGISIYSKRYLSQIYPLKRVCFEGALLNVPNDSEGYLTNLYGDWNSVPQEDRIQNHHVEVIFK